MTKRKVTKQEKQERLKSPQLLKALDKLKKNLILKYGCSVEEALKRIEKVESVISKDLGGRAPEYDKPEELQEKITEYFETGIEVKKVMVGRAENMRVEEVKMPTISGLCHFLGFESRQSFYDYEKREGFSYIIKRARLFIEKEYEQMLQVNPRGAEFALMNFGWEKKQTNVNISRGEDKRSDEEILAENERIDAELKQRTDKEV
jgi:hypothetical protein